MKGSPIASSTASFRNNPKRKSCLSTATLRNNNLTPSRSSTCTSSSPLLLDNVYSNQSISETVSSAAIDNSSVAFRDMSNKELVARSDSGSPLIVIEAQEISDMPLERESPLSIGNARERLGSSSGRNDCLNSTKKDKLHSSSAFDKQSTLNSHLSIGAARTTALDDLPGCYTSVLGRVNLSPRNVSPRENQSRNTSASTETSSRARRELRPGMRPLLSETNISSFQKTSAFQCRIANETNLTETTRSPSSSNLMSRVANVATSSSNSCPSSIANHPILRARRQGHVGTMFMNPPYTTERHRTRHNSMHLCSRRSVATNLIPTFRNDSGSALMNISGDEGTSGEFYFTLF